MPSLRVATLNILNDLSRWAERRSLLADGLAELRPDLVALQEVSLPLNNAQWLADRLGEYAVHLCPKTGVQAGKEAIAILSRLPVECTARLDLLTQNRVAQYVQVRLAGRPLVFINGHFYWRPGEAAERVKQVHRLLDWLGAVPHGTALVACGDFNGTPESAAITLMREHFASAYAVRHGREPEYTCPTPLVRPGDILRTAASYVLNLVANRSLRPWRGTLDYIFVNQRVGVVDCEVVLNRPASNDQTLYPSDHFGLAATLDLG